VKRGVATVDELLSGPRPRVKGLVEFGHKTGGHLVYVIERDYDTIRRQSSRRGYGSNLKFVRS